MLCHQTQKSRDLSTVAGGVLLSSAASNGFWLGLGPWVRRNFGGVFILPFWGQKVKTTYIEYMLCMIYYIQFLYIIKENSINLSESFICVCVYIYIYIYVFTYTHIFDIHQMQHWPQRQLR